MLSINSDSKVCWPIGYIMSLLYLNVIAMFILKLALAKCYHGNNVAPLWLRIYHSYSMWMILTSLSLSLSLSLSFPRSFSLSLLVQYHKQYPQLLWLPMLITMVLYMLLRMVVPGLIVLYPHPSDLSVMYVNLHNYTNTVDNSIVIYILI